MEGTRYVGILSYALKTPRLCRNVNTRLPPGRTSSAMAPINRAVRTVVETINNSVTSDEVTSATAMYLKERWVRAGVRSCFQRYESVLSTTARVLRSSNIFIFGRFSTDRSENILLGIHWKPSRSGKNER